MHMIPNRISWLYILCPLTLKRKASENFFLAYFPYLEKINVGLCDHHAVCVWLCIASLSTFEFLNQIWYVFHGTWTHPSGVFHKSHQSVCVSQYRY
jgi:hypothetical protein